MIPGHHGSNAGVFLWVLISAVGWLLAGAAVGLWGCVNSGLGNDEELGRIHFLDVGQGLSVLLEQNGRYALFDAGPDSVGVMDSLVARGVDTLEWAVVSHNHRDHGGGALELASGKGNDPLVHIRRLYVGPDTSGYFVRDSLLRIADRFQIPVDTLYRGDQLSLGNLTFKVLWPPSFMRVGDNGASLVLRGFAGGAQSGTSGGSPSQVERPREFMGETSFLLTGDLDSAGERQLLELSTDIHSNLLQVGHHGSAGSSSLRFLSQVAPRQAVISVGADNSYGHPTEAVLRKLEYIVGAVSSSLTPEDSSESQLAKKNIWRTDQDGTVSFEIVPGVGLMKK